MFSPEIEKWLALTIFVATFALVLYRRFNIAYVSLAAAALLLILGVTNIADAFLKEVNWDVLAIYWGYGMLAIAFRESQIPAWVANRITARIKTEKYVLLFLCALSMALSSFMANPVVVIMLAPLAIEISGRLKSSLFLYLVTIAISSNAVTTVSMIADPPAIILATTTGMNFLDFYWFQGKIGLGTLSVIGIFTALAMLLVLFNLRKMNNRVDIAREDVKVSFGALTLFILSVLTLAFIPWNSLGNWNHPGIVGFLLGLLSLGIGRRYVKEMLTEFDWSSILFLVGIFIVVAAMENAGWLEDFAGWLGSTGLKSPTFYLAIFVWLSVALSSFIDNVPYTVLMLPVCASVAQTLGVNPFPFYFGMLVGTGIGGNISPVGATSNVLACGMLEKRGYQIQLGKYLAISVPFTLAAVLPVHLLLQLLWL